MHIGTLYQVMHENIVKSYYKNIYDKTPAATESRYLAKLTGNRLADKHGFHPLMGSIPGAMSGFIVGGPVGAATGAVVGTGTQWLLRKLHKKYGNK